MYPDFSYLFHDVFGTAPDNWLSIFKTFGVFLALAFAASAYFLKLELKRKGEDGLFTPVMTKTTVGEKASIMDIISNGMFGFLLGFKALAVYEHFEAFKFDPSAIIFSKEGNWIGGILGFAVFGFLVYYEKYKKRLDPPKVIESLVKPHENTFEITFAAGIGGILGAKIFAIFESARSLENFVLDPVGTFFSGSGLAIYGGLIGGFIAVFLLIRKLGIKTIHMMDATAPALLIGYGVGRIGCQLSGDGDWGIDAAAKPSWWFLPDWLWSYKYPNNVSLQGENIPNCIGHYCKQLVNAAYPTPVYETILAFIIFGILWSLRKRIKIPGVLFFLYMLLNGIERFFIEKIRVNDKINAMGLTFTQAEFIAVMFVLIGTAGIAYLYFNNQKPKQEHQIE
jgi:phosphatidylglycerol---prolipoprotein diacylglyceryl transferase